MNEHILEQAIVKCNQMITTTKEYSHERLRLVRRLVELRLKFAMITELKVFENKELMNNNAKVIFGHHLSLVWKPDWLTTNFCDVCTKTIWKNMHQFYKCAGRCNICIYLVKLANIKSKCIILDCGYYCHVFCIGNIKRICTAIVASEHSMIMTICPYNGLLSQDYKCVECQSYIRIRNIKVSPGTNTDIILFYFYLY